MIEQHRPGTNFGNGFEVVRDEEHGGATLDDRANAVHAALLKNEVTDAQHLIDDQHFWIHMSSDREARRAYIPEE